MAEVSTIGNIYNNIIRGIAKVGIGCLIMLQGSARSGKTYNIMIFLIQACMKKKIVVTVVRASLPSVKRSVFHDFLEIMFNMGIYVKERMNKTTMVYTFENGSEMEFVAFDDEQKARGPSRDILFVNEANEVEEQVFNQLRARTRLYTIIDFNPSFTEEHWIFRKMGDDRTFHFISTFQDNPFLSDAIRDEIFSYKYTNPALWQIFGCGEFAIVEGLVFPKNSWDTCGFTEIPIDCHKKEIGMDFGFTHDPTAAVLCFFKTIGTEQHLWLHELMYDTGMKEKNIAYRLKAYNDIVKRVDSANPLLISNLEDNGMTLIQPVQKYAQSISDGIQKMLGYHIHVTKSSTNIIKEFRNYTWMKDRHDQWTSTPIDKFNHCFVGDTMIQMSDGSRKRIADIMPCDYVMTSSGARMVLKHFRNGRKTVYEYELKTNNGIVTVTATMSHKVKTTTGWKQISELKAGDVVFLSRHLTEKSLDYTQESGISQEGQQGCTSMFGSIITDLSKRAITFITRMRMLLTTTYQTLRYLSAKSICQCMVKRLHQLKKDFGFFARKWTMQELMHLCGTEVKRGANGIVNMLSKWSESKKTQSVSNVEQSTGQSSLNASVLTGVNQSGDENPALTTSSQNALFVEELLLRTNTQDQCVAVESVLESIRVIRKSRRQVYNMMVDDCHEYFANRLLVSNCVDAVRYVVMADRSARNSAFGKRIISKRKLGL